MNVSEDTEKRELQDTVGGNVNWCSHCEKLEVAQKLKIELSYDPAILFLGIYLEKKMKMLI